jgi:hypothetical protein
MILPSGGALSFAASSSACGEEIGSSEKFYIEIESWNVKDLLPAVNELLFAVTVPAS